MIRGSYVYQQSSLTVLGEFCVIINLFHSYKFVSQSRTGLQIYAGHDDQLNRPGPMA
jgi:hypothetical protein